jgi:hypothetical protein
MAHTDCGADPAGQAVITVGCIMLAATLELRCIAAVVWLTV